MMVAGVDGRDAGWLVVRAYVGGHLRLVDVSISRTFVDVVEATSGCTVVGLDIPIGLTEGPPREADMAARKFLGPRASSFFPAPVRPVLEAKSAEDARRLSMQASGKSVSPYALGFLPKVREVDQTMAQSPRLQDRIHEAHPEVSFWALNGRRNLRHAKKSPAGSLKRLQLVSRHLDFELEQTAVEGRAALDDFLDACAAAWTARRVAKGQAERLPPDPPKDSRGLWMEIVY